MADYLTQREAAQMLRVSVSYLRASDCPKVLLPPNKGTRPIVRYSRAAIEAWAGQWAVASAVQPIRRKRRVA